MTLSAVNQQEIPQIWRTDLECLRHFAAAAMVGADKTQQVTPSPDRKRSDFEYAVKELVSNLHYGSARQIRQYIWPLLQTCANHSDYFIRKYTCPGLAEMAVYLPTEQVQQQLLPILWGLACENTCYNSTEVNGFALRALGRIAGLVRKDHLPKPPSPYQQKLAAGGRELRPQDIVCPDVTGLIIRAFQRNPSLCEDRHHLMTCIAAVGDVLSPQQGQVLWPLVWPIPQANDEWHGRRSLSTLPAVAALWGAINQDSSQEKNHHRTSFIQFAMDGLGDVGSKNVWVPLQQAAAECLIRIWPDVPQPDQQTVWQHIQHQLKITKNHDRHSWIRLLAMLTPNLPEQQQQEAIALLLRQMADYRYPKHGEYAQDVLVNMTGKWTKNPDGVGKLGKYLGKSLLAKLTGQKDHVRLQALQLMTKLPAQACAPKHRQQMILVAGVIIRKEKRQNQGAAPSTPTFSIAEKRQAVNVLMHAVTVNRSAAEPIIRLVMTHAQQPSFLTAHRGTELQAELQKLQQTLWTMPLTGIKNR